MTVLGLSLLGRAASVNVAMTTQRRRKGISPGLSFFAGVVLALTLVGIFS